MPRAATPAPAPAPNLHWNEKVRTASLARSAVYSGSHRVVDTLFRVAKQDEQHQAVDSRAGQAPAAGCNEGLGGEKAEEEGLEGTPRWLREYMEGLGSEVHAIT